MFGSRSLPDGPRQGREQSTRTARGGGIVWCSVEKGLPVWVAPPAPPPSPHDPCLTDSSRAGRGHRRHRASAFKLNIFSKPEMSRKKYTERCSWRSCCCLPHNGPRGHLPPLYRARADMQQDTRQDMQQDDMWSGGGGGSDGGFVDQRNARMEQQHRLRSSSHRLYGCSSVCLAASRGALRGRARSSRAPVSSSRCSRRQRPSERRHNPLWREPRARLTSLLVPR